MLAQLALSLLALGSLAPVLAAGYYKVQVPDDRIFTSIGAPDPEVNSGETREFYAQDGSNGRVYPLYPDFLLINPTTTITCRFVGDFPQAASPTFLFGAGKLCQEHDGMHVECDGVQC